VTRTLLGLLLALATACDAGTGGALVDIDVALASAGQQGSPPGRFETSTGFTVMLEEARLQLASLFVYADEGEARAALRSLVFGRALAHGGYDPFNGKRVRVEVAGPITLDLLATEPMELGAIEAEAGSMESATLVFGDLAGQPSQAFVRGTATRDGVAIPFEGALELEDEALIRRADGIPARGDLRAGGRLTLRVKLDPMFDEAHFDRLAGEGDGAALITPETQVHTAWVLGVRSPKTFSIEWKAP
jgi:hypothetical protein